MSQNAHLTLRGKFRKKKGKKKKISSSVSPPMMDPHSRQIGLRLPLLPFPDAASIAPVYFVLRRRLNMHELSSILDLDGSL